jgi:CHASE3 domain sensor protein
MMTSMERYVIAVKRDQRQTVKLSDALNRLSGVRGYTIVGDTQGVRTVIQADDAAARRIKQLLSDCCYVEREVLHALQAGSYR